MENNQNPKEDIINGVLCVKEEGQKHFRERTKKELTSEIIELRSNLQRLGFMMIKMKQQLNPNSIQ